MLRLLIQTVKVVTILTLAAVVVLAGRSLLLSASRAAVVASAPVTVRIHHNESLSHIASALQRAGVIRLGPAFTVLTRLHLVGSRFHAGTFRLRHDMTVEQVIHALETPARTGPPTG